MAHGIAYMEIHWRTAQVRHVTCLCGKTFYPLREDTYASFNAHLRGLVPQETVSVEDGKH